MKAPPASKPPLAVRALPAGLAAAVLLAATGGALAGGRQSDSALVARLDSTMSRTYPAGGPGAVLLVSRGGRVVLRRGYGLADVGRGAPVTPETVFRLASVSKLFTATAVLMLVERGMVALDSPVTAYLAGSPPAWSGITLRHLLTHASGLAEYLDRPDVFTLVGSERTVEELLASFRDRPPAFSPGERERYGNSGYILLGAVVERVSGVPFADFVRANIFEPAGMRTASCGGPLSGVRGLAEAYEPARTAAGEPDWGRLVVARRYTMSALHGAGGCVGAVDDLLRFDQALLGGRLLRPETVALGLSPARLAGGGPGGMAPGGWQLDRVAGRRAAMKGGSLPGVCTWYVTMPDDGVAVILLTNRSAGQPRCGALAVGLAEAVAGR